MICPYCHQDRDEFDGQCDPLSYCSVMYVVLEAMRELPDDVPGFVRDMVRTGRLGVDQLPRAEAAIHRVLEAAGLLAAPSPCVDREAPRAGIAPRAMIVGSRGME